MHSFTGSREEMERLVQMGLCVGVNGCSLKSEGNLEVVRHIPLDRLMLETDGPWVSLMFFLFCWGWGWRLWEGGDELMGFCWCRFSARFVLRMPRRNIW